MRIALRNAVNCPVVPPGLPELYCFFRETAVEQPAFAVLSFVYPPAAQDFCGIKISPADNLLQEQQKQP
jgi:hypothetical protein